MEPSFGSNSATTEEASTRRVANRINRALQHQLRLLHRAGADFFVLGAMGNAHTVKLATTPACTSPDPGAPCKHIVFVLLRDLGLSLDEAYVWRQSLCPCQVASPRPRTRRCSPALATTASRSPARRCRAASTVPLPGVPRGDGAFGRGTRRRGGHGAGAAADVRHVPEGTRRVFRAVEAHPREVGSDVRCVPRKVVEAEPGPGAGPAALHQPVGIHMNE